MPPEKVERSIDAVWQYYWPEDLVKGKLLRMFDETWMQRSTMQLYTRDPPTTMYQDI